MEPLCLVVAAAPLPALVIGLALALALALVWAVDDVEFVRHLGWYRVQDDFGDSKRAAAGELAHARVRPVAVAGDGRELGRERCHLNRRIAGDACDHHQCPDLRRVPVEVEPGCGEHAAVALLGAGEESAGERFVASCDQPPGGVCRPPTRRLVRCGKERPEDRREHIRALCRQFGAGHRLALKPIERPA